MVLKEKIFPDFTSKELTLLEILRWRSENQKEQLAYLFLEDGKNDEKRLNYRRLDLLAQRIGGELQQRAAKGERVLLLYPSGLDYIIAFYGCLYGGAIAVPAYPPDPSRLEKTLPRLRAIVQDSGARFILTNSAIYSFVKSHANLFLEFRSLTWLVFDFETSTFDKSWKESYPKSTDVAFIQYTSGSTAHPKGVIITHKNLWHNALYIRKMHCSPASSVGVYWLPMYHDMGLVGGILQCMYEGYPAVLMSPYSFIKKPLYWLRAITKYKGTHSASPNFGFEHCIRRITLEEKRDLELSSWKVAFNGAEPIRLETIQRFIQAFEPCGFHPESMFPCYGLAESTLLVSGKHWSPTSGFKKVDPQALQQNQVIEINENGYPSKGLIACGQAFLDRKIIIVDYNTGLECPSKSVGEIWVKGPQVGYGYWNQKQDTKKYFLAYLRTTGEGPFLRTGDLGFLDEGELYITGRLKDLIKIMGKNHYAQDIEYTVEKSHPAIRPGCGAAFPIETEEGEKVVVVSEVEIQFNDSYQHIISNIRKAIIENHDIDPQNIVLLYPKTIKKTSSGKIQRHSCREGYLKGELEFLAEMKG